PARKKINDWVVKKTQTKIRDLLPPGSITSLTRLVLVNAIYFKGKWAHPFDARNTRPGPFQLRPNETIDVPMMSQTGMFKMTRADGVQVLEMPYIGEQIAMTVVLPDAADGLAAVEQKLTGTTLDRWFSALQDQRVRVVLPRFKVSSPESIALRPHLE